MKHKSIFKLIIRQFVPVMLGITLLSGTAWAGSGFSGEKEVSANSEAQQAIVVTGR